jgi:hypothetical protein
MSSELDAVAERFRGFADFAAGARDSPLYARLCHETADNPAVTRLLLEAAPAQRWPMLLLAAVNLETRRSGEPYPVDGEQLARYCSEHREQLVATIATHSTQTNEVGRCAYLLPCFAHASDGRPLALVEVGTSAGLALNWDRYGYDYGAAGTAGDPGSAVKLSCEVRAGRPPLEAPRVTWRAGIDLAPRPDDEWLRACVFADQPERLERLDAALAIAREHPPRLVQGDAMELLPRLLAEAPGEAQVVVFHTAVLAYIGFDRAEQLRELTRDVTYVAAEDPQQLAFRLEVDGVEVGLGQPHGRWLEWTA